MLALDPDELVHHPGAAAQRPLRPGPADPHQATENTDAYLRLLDIPAGTDTAKALRALPAEQLLDAYGRLSAQRPPQATRPRRYTRPSTPRARPTPGSKHSQTTHRRATRSLRRPTRGHHLVRQQRDMDVCHRWVGAAPIDRS